MNKTSKKIFNLVKEIKMSDDKEKIYSQIFLLTQNTIFFDFEISENLLGKSRYKSEKKRKEIFFNAYDTKRNRNIREYEGLERSDYLGLFDYKNWTIADSETLSSLFDIGARLDKVLVNYPIKIKSSLETEYIEFVIEKQFERYLIEYFDWLRNQKKLNFFQLCQLLYNDFNDKFDFKIDKIREYIFQTDFRDFEYESIWIPENDKNGNWSYKSFEKIFKAFWTIKDLDFRIETKFCFIKSKFGEIKISTNSFINIFLAPYDDDSWGMDRTYEGEEVSYIDFHSFNKKGYGLIFSKNLSSFCIALENVKEKYGFYFGIDRHSILASLLPAFRFDDDHLPMVYTYQTRDNSETYPALVELLFIGVLTHPLMDCDITYGLQSENLFTKRVYRNSVQTEDDAYINWVINAYHQLQNMRCYELSEIYILLGTINTIWHDKLETKSWKNLLDIISDKNFSEQKRKILFQFIYNNQPKKITEYKMYFQDRFASLLNEKNSSQINNQKFITLTKEYTKNMNLDEYSKDQITQHFTYYQFSLNAKNYRDNITLPLFKAVENEIFKFLKKQKIINQEEERNTNFHTMLILLREFVSNCNLSDKQVREWNKVKRQAFQLAKIRNKAAHASIMEATEVIKSQDGVKKILNWFSSFKLQLGY